MIYNYILSILYKYILMVRRNNNFSWCTDDELINDASIGNFYIRYHSQEHLIL